MLIAGAAADDAFGKSVSLSSDGMIVAIGATRNDDNGTLSGHARLFSYASSTNIWDLLGSPIVGVESNNHFGCSISLSSNGMIVAIKAD